MKIKKSPSKKLAPLPRQLSDLIRRLEVEEKEQIPTIIRELSSWPYARGDLFHWAVVLDRLDAILLDICTEYNLKDIQTKPFDDQTKELILSIIDLSCTLFENCTNRNIYNSYEHLNMLLNTFDMDVLEQVLHFLIRPAQRINNPRAIRSSFVIPQDKIVELARGWSHVTVELLRIAQDLTVTPKMTTLNIQFYRTTTTEGHQVITENMADQVFQHKQDVDVFMDLVKKYDVPKESQFELANRIRIAKHVSDPEKRRQLLGIRILAITVMSHAISETTAQNKVFIYEPYLISQLAELISPEKQVDTTIQTYVLYALDGITRHRNKLSEVLIAVNASANHGTMMQILRKTNLNQAYPQPFLDALFTFVSYLLQTQPGGQMLMSAGIIPTLVQLVGNHQYTQLKNVAKVVGLIDTIVNSFATSFSAFCNANGLDTLLNRIKMEIETCTKSAMPNEDQLNATSTVPYDRLSTIKAMLKFLLRMMESSGTTDGLRNLIDSSLPQSLKLIMEDPKLFGNSIFALAINVSTTFIHNEPTSLPILQEAKLPQSFLHTISTYDSPNNEVLMAAVNAFGAMCLNAQGLDMFNTEKPLPHFFDLLTSHDFLRNPMDVDSATGLGSTMDELIRHHPSLKPSVFQCVTSLIKKVIEMGSDVNGVGKSSDNSHLLQTSSEDTAMSAATSTTTATKPTTAATEEGGEGEDKPEKVECLLVSFIDLVARFLEGLFQNQSNIKEFVQEGCPEMLLNYYALPLLPANFSVTIASDSLSYLFRMISEVSPLPTVLAIAAKVKESIRFITDKTDDYQKSTLMEFVDVNATETDKVERGNELLRQMIQLHGYVGLLSNICCSSVLSHGRNGASLVTEFLSESKQENIIQLLGQLHRHMVWENLLLKEALPPAWYAAKSSSSTNALGALKKGPASMAEHPLGIYSTNTQTEVSASTTVGAEEAAASSSAKQDGASKDKTDEKAPAAKDPRMVNIKHFKILLGEIPQLLVPIFQGLIKVSVSRRTNGALPKSQTMKLAEYMSDLLRDNITWSPISQATAPACKYDYLTSVYTMTSLLLRDERTQSSLQTPLAIAFEKQGGIDLLLSNLKDMWATAQALYEEQDKEKHKDLLARINSSIESLLNVLLHISSPKSLRDSAYTTTLIQKDKKAEDYFDPYEWIVSLELKLVPLKDYLTCPQLRLFSKTVNQTLIKVFQQIMKGEGGFAGLSSTATSTTRGAGATVGDPFGNFTAPLMTSPFTLLRTPVVAAERNIQTLVDMGFERASAEQALVRCNNQVSRAVDYLFSHPTPIFGGSNTATTTPPAPPATETSSEAAPTNNNTQEDTQINQEVSSDDDDEGEDDENNEHHNEDENEHDDDDGEDDDNSLNDSDNMEGVIDTFVESLNNDYRLDAATSGLRRSLFNSIGGGSGSNEASASESANNEPSEHVKELKAVRQSLCESLPVALLALADQREDLVFDVRDLLILLGKYEEEEQSPENKRANTTKTSLSIIALLVDQIGDIRDDSSKSVLLSNRLRLLALLLREPPMQNAMNQLADRFSFLFDMLNFSSLGQDDPLPAWSATIFLVLEAFIAQADEPKKAKLKINPRRGGMFFSSSASSDEDDNEQEITSKSNADDKNKQTGGDDDEDVAMEDVDAPSTSAGSASKTVGISAEQRGKLLQCCVSLLRKTKLSRDDIYAILRMIVRLTKDHESALHFLGIGGVPLLFSKPRSSLEGLQGQQAFIILILRHIVESKAVLQSTMKDIITNWFTNPRPRNMDISSFVRSNAHVALREPDVFVQVTTDICRLARYDEFEINHQIKLKKQQDDKQDADSSAATTTTTTKQASSSEVVVYYLLNEIMTVRTEATAVASRKEPLTDEQKKEENIKFVYTGFLLQCLVELISSYPSCKYDIFNFCKKQNGQRTTTLDGKHRSFVSMLINDLLPYNHINPSSEDTQKQQGLSTWTASTLVAMSYDASSSSDMSAQQKNELIQVRKYVLEAVVRALKEAVASSDTASVKYSKYLALADLCHRILNARPNVGSSIPRSLGGNGGQTNASNSKEDAALSNTKIMLDKNFVAILTSAISDVDINYPHAKTILNSMLRPLEQLTKLAIKTDDDSDNDDEDQDKMDTTEEGMHVPSTPAAEGEEAPDLYRNSALGMFDAGSVIDDDEYNSGEYSDIFGSSADEQEDFDEQSGSDLSDMDESDQENEEGFDSDDMDQDEMADDIDAEAQLISDEDDDDEEGGRELTWHLEDIEQEPGIVHAETVIDTGDERDEPNHIRHLSDPYEEEDEMDALSDFDDASENLDNDSDNELADGMILDSEDLDTPFLPTDFHEELIMDGDELERPRSIIPAGFRRRFHNGRRTLLEGVGRSFRNQANTHGQEDIITHPLLSNNTGNQASNSGGNSARSMIDEALSRRDLGGAPNLRNWQDFEDIIGGSAVRMLEDILTHAPSATQAGPLRVDVTSGPGGVLRTFEFDRLPHLSGLGGHGAHLSSPALGGALGAASGSNAGASNDQIQEGLAILHDFQPMTSGERWNQEGRMMYGPNLGDKALKLVNKLLNILTPIAIEDDKKTRAEEEKKRQEQRRKEEEERRKAEEEKWRLAKEARRAEAEAAEAAAAAAAAEAAAHAPTANAESSTSAATEATAVGEAATQPQTNTPSDSNAETAAEPSTTADVERTIVTIRGEPVDISGTGIDKEFLEALPDDLREEVLNQHLRDRPAPPQPAEDDSISPEFLSALPPDIRQEVIHQEAIERERRERQNRQQAPTSATATALSATPASAGTTNTTAASDSASASRRRPAPAEDDAKTPKKKAKARRQDGAAQLVEKSQLGTLVRLLFVPQTISKSILNRLLLNLCENSKTRGDLLSYLVCVLYDGNNDLASVDSSFALLSSSTLPGKSGKSASSKPSRANSTSSSANAATVTDNVPNFIAQRCLEALTYIVSNNEQSMTYFLTESESLVSLKRSSSSRKGKSKEKVPVSWNKYPILVLMSLLDRPVFINNSTLMEQLMDLLSTMCRPFPILVKKYQEKVENKQKDPNSSERPMPKPPTIPDYYLKLVVHVLTNGECSSKTFQYTLNAISHLSALDGAQQAIVNELVEDAKQSGTQILKDLESLLVVLETAMPGTEINSTVLAPFAAATSYQAKLLRVLKTLDYMFSRKNATAMTASAENKASNELVQAKNEKRMLQIYQDLNFLPLWQNLGECLSVIREKEELINVATVLLPLIESFMVVSKCTAEKGQNNVYEKVATPAIEQQLTLSTTSPESFFFVFTEKHKKVLNIMVRNNPTLMSGSFALLVRNPKMLEFDNKRNYFVQQLHKRTTPRENYAMLQLNVRRQYVFEDSYHQLQGRTGEEIKNGKLAVRFYDEEGVDAGGVTREWFSVLARQMFDPNYALFITSAADKLTYQPNRDSAVNPDHLSFFKFVGRVIGKAIYDGRLLDAYFTRSFYKHILGRTVDYRDVEALDPEYYKSLVWMLENDITDIIDLTFSIETDFFGTKETVDLKPDGRNIPVTEANKHEYVTLVTEQKLTTAIKDQINAFVQGFHDVIPAPLIQIFNEQELELLISGLPDIDIDDWKNNTEYQGYTASSPPVQWFWRAVRSFDQEERAKLLQFATGTSKVPLEGFSQLQGSSGVQKFQIHKDFGGENRLPSAHTCFNQVDLPQYDCYENLRANLFKAISECSTGFAFV